jgi:hypothetical protein
MKILRALCTGFLMLITGCSSAKVEDYAGHTPTLDIRQYLNGDIEAWGMFIDNSGKADPMFQVKMKGEWQGNKGTLKEHFIYSDGHTKDRLWNLEFQDDHTFTGTAADVVGIAKGTQSGNAAHIAYVLTVTTEDGSSYNMSMDDWLFQMNDELVLNRNEMRKFGIKVGELIISFHKPKR